MKKRKRNKKYYFYILRCLDKTLYCGITIDLIHRSIMHNLGKGSIYVRSRGGGKVVYHEICGSLSKAFKREAQVKKWPRSKKLKLIKLARSSSRL